MKWFAVVVVIGILFTIAGGANTTAAATPSPTPTLPPITPSATPGFINFRPTPSPFPIAVITVMPIDLTGKPEVIADTAINIYRWANRDGVVDAAMFIVVVVFVLLAAVRMIGSVTQERS